MDRLTCLSNLNMSMEEVPHMSMGKLVTLLTKCGRMGSRPKALIRLLGAQVFPMTTLDVTGDFLMTRVFIQSYQCTLVKGDSRGYP